MGAWFRLLLNPIGIRKKSVFFRTAFLLTAAFSAIVLFGSLIYYFSIRSYFLQEIHDNDTRVVGQTAAAYEAFLDSLIQTSALYMEMENNNNPQNIPEDGSEQHREIYSRLTNITKISDYIHSVYYFDKRKELIYVSGGYNFEMAKFLR